MATPLATAPADTHCPYCALQCAMTLTPTVDPAPGTTPVTVTGRAFPTNRGGLCAKGWTSAELLASGQRLTAPLLKQADGTFVEASWEHALDTVAAGVRSAQERHGSDAVAVFGGGGLTNEKAYQLGKFARVALGTSRIDYNGRFCMSSAAAAGNRAFGVDRGLPFPVSDLDTADTILLLGSNVAATMPPFIGHLSGARSRAGLVVVDPRRSATARLTEDGGGTHLQPAPGTDLALLLGLTHLVIAEGLADTAYLADRTSGYDAVRRSVSAWWPERTAATTGVPVELLRSTARRLAGDSVYILTGRGVEQHVDGTDTATAAINLALVLGLVGREGSGYGTLTGQGNGQGGREHGQKADQLPGYRSIRDPEARAHVASVWGVDPESLPGAGLPAVALLGELGGSVHCLLVHGSNVVVSAPDADAVRAGLAELDTLVVCDFFLSETAALADVVLPVTQWAEEEGTMTSLEGRVLRRRRALAAPDGVRSELWILSELARRLDAPSTWSTEPAEVFDELARASAGGVADYSGLSHALLDTGVEAYWPFPVGSAGTPRLFADRFGHADGRARLVAVTPDPARTDVTDRGGELTLVTGRYLQQYQSGTQTRRVRELDDARPEARLEIHPATASRLGIGEGAVVAVGNARGTVRARATVTADIRHDTVFLPFHYAGEQCANLLTEAAVDPVSSMPEFKRTRVWVRPDGAIDA
ncbi:assimilatory nitrate reductase (NADH) alpha subunit apoprotein [Labedella gwakjiensis]|uniref:Assimilatory nitrate reductase (NADH) alpha subunit apoprotein n=1 Tax=Labedella gwakjiensis TaxID=390269 RepID=A0A2P8GUU2_9MICO|nr:molybdopterin oxidoreductase family protein [Labedella gwakjiensis]PSL37737.1 assimilatory nitrate reductase (NADH) alpha subunit apoprotein [Labedella gwakjiensis]RUQ87674.1 nitrite reductase [Labedella gwakjiensis]